eukprot:Skav225280  [mRNA]  locus=scaffold4099:208277:211812:+ [translate_table: standard]
MIVLVDHVCSSEFVCWVVARQQERVYKAFGFVVRGSDQPLLLDAKRNRLHRRQPCARPEARLAERARASQTSLRAESFGAALARVPRYSQQPKGFAGGVQTAALRDLRQVCDFDSCITGGSATHSLLSRGYLDRMRGMSARPTAPLAPLAMRCLAPCGTTGRRMLPQMGGAVSVTVDTVDRESARTGRLAKSCEICRPREEVVRKPCEVESTGSPQMRLGSPRVNLQSNSHGKDVDGGPLCGTSLRNGTAYDAPAPAFETNVIDVASRLHHGEPVVRQAAAAALGALGEVAAEHVRELASLIQDMDSGVRKAAAIALGNLGHKAVGHADAASAPLPFQDLLSR